MADAAQGNTDDAAVDASATEDAGSMLANVDTGEDAGTDTTTSSEAADTGRTPGTADEQAGESDSEGTSDDDAAKEGEEEGASEYESFDATEGVPINAEALESFIPVFKDLDLSQEQAQTLVDAQSKVALAQQAQFVAKQKAEIAEFMKDPDHKEVSVRAKRLIDKYGDDAEQDLLLGEYLGNSPVMFRFLNKVAKAMGEGVMPDTGTAPVKQSLGKTLYPNSPGMS